MKQFGKRFVIVGAVVIMTLIAAAATRTRAVQRWFDTVTVTGKVTTYLLDNEARVNGLLLDTGQQIRFGPQMGSAVVARITTGDTVSVTGRAGRAATFGRMVHAAQITSHGDTIFALDSPPRPPRPRPHGRRADAPPPPRPSTAPRPDDASSAPSPLGAPPPPEPVVAPTPDRAGSPPSGLADTPAAPGAETPAATTTTRGTVVTFLVNDHGDVDGLLMSGGELVHFGPDVGDVITADPTAKGIDVVVEGYTVRGEHGTVVRPTRLTVGRRTIVGR